MINDEQILKCKTCGSNNFVEIVKTQSNKEKRTGRELKFIVCKTCDPVFASLSLLDDGFEIASKIVKAQLVD